MLLPTILNSINPLMKERYIGEILECNERTGEYGLVLTAEEARGLIEARNNALNHYGRVDLSIDTVKVLIDSFYKSSFINNENYASTLNELQEIFYYLKNETEDMLSDEKLISIIREHFENTCGGSLDFLRSTMDEFAEDFRRKAQKNSQYGEGED